MSPPLVEIPDNDDIPIIDPEEDLKELVTFLPVVPVFPLGKG